MKRTVAYYFLLLYTIAACKPVLPVIKDVVAHAFWNAKHVATVHQHDGDHHVHSEVNKVAAQDHEDQNTPTPKASEPVSIHIPANHHYDFRHLSEGNKRYFFSLNARRNPYLEKDFLPPKI
jgi:hypothetical protein